MHTIILDTNFCMIPFQFKVDIVEEIGRVCLFPHKVCVLDQTITELETLVKNTGGANKAAAKFSLSYIKTNKIQVLSTSQDADVDGLLLAMKPDNLIVGTQDQALKRKLKERGVRLLVMRNKSYVELV